jgi:hypothetical protein
MTRPFLGRRDRILLGVIVLIVGLGISALRYYSTRGPLEALAWVEKNRTPSDSAMYASAVYHATYAQQTLQTKWSAGGFGTQAVVVAVAGLVLLFAPSRRSPTS